MDSIIVLGGSGFIGSILVQKLTKQGVSVRVYDVENPKVAVQNVKYIQGSILDRQVLKQAMSGCDIIYHLAAHLPVAHDKSNTLSEALLEVNVAGTQCVLEAAKETSIKRIVYTSSTAVYGIPSRNPIDESTTPFKPVEAYGISKTLAEEACKEFADAGNDVVIIRPCPVVGPGRLGVFQILFEWIYRGWNVPILGDGKNILQFIHVDDCANAIVAAGELPYEPNRFSAFNVGASDLVPLKQGLETLIQQVGSKSKVRSLPKALIIMGVIAASKLRLLPLSPFHALIYGESVYSSNVSAQTELAWEPAYSYLKILETAYEWYCANRTQILDNQSGSVHQRAPKQGLLSLVRFLP